MSPRVVSSSNLISLALDSSSSLLGLDVSPSVVGIAATGRPQASYPNSSNPPRCTMMCMGIHGIEVINRRNLRAFSVAKKLEKLVEIHRACGLVVGWPLQLDGKPGKQCFHVARFLKVWKFVPVPRFMLLICFKGSVVGDVGRGESLPPHDPSDFQCLTLHGSLPYIMPPRKLRWLGLICQSLYKTKGLPHCMLGKLDTNWAVAARGRFVIRMMPWPLRRFYTGK